MADARVLHRLLLLFIIVGIAFSTYSAFETLYPAGRGVCSINSYVNCGKVASSAWATVGPFPDWSVGLGGFLILLALDIPLIRTYDPRLLTWVLAFATLGLTVAVVFGSIEVLLIHAFCPICLGAYISDLGVFVVALTLYRQHRAQLAERARRRAEASSG
jgi:uncharacterized membrane protein